MIFCLAKTSATFLFLRTKRSLIFTQAFHGLTKSFCISPLIKSRKVSHRAFENLRQNILLHIHNMASMTKHVTNSKPLALYYVQSLNKFTIGWGYVTPLEMGSGWLTVWINSTNSMHKLSWPTGSTINGTAGSYSPPPSGIDPSDQTPPTPPGSQGALPCSLPSQEDSCHFDPGASWACIKNWCPALGTQLWATLLLHNFSSSPASLCSLRVFKVT